MDVAQLSKILSIPVHDSAGLNALVDIAQELFQLEALSLSDAWGQVLVSFGEMRPDCPSVALYDGASMSICPALPENPLFAHFVERAALLVEYLTLKTSLEIERQQRLISNTLQDISLSLTSQHDLETVFNKILAEVARVLPYDAASVWLIENNESYMITGIGYEKYGIKAKLKLRFRADEDPILREIIETRRVVIIPDVKADSRW